MNIERSRTWAKEIQQALGEYLRGDPVLTNDETLLTVLIQRVREDAFNEASKDVENMAKLFVGNTKVDGTRDPVVYEQGIGCERASLMLKEKAKLLKI